MSSDLATTLDLLARAGDSCATFVLKHGRDYWPDNLTYDGPRGLAHRCYETVGKAALEDGGTYVEGYVSMYGIPIEHAWLEKDGRVIDPTLDGAGVKGYFGVTVSVPLLRETVLKTRVWGVLPTLAKDFFTDEEGIVHPIGGTSDYQPARGEWKALSSKFAGRLTDDEKTALKGYSQYEYQQINAYLRTGSVTGIPLASEAKASALAAAMDSAIAKGSLPTETVLSRGAGSDKVDPALLKEGSTFTDKGFVSTSAKESFAASWAHATGGNKAVLFKITAPAGTPVAYMGKMAPSYEQKERELVLPRGSTFTVDKVTPQTDANLMTVHLTWKGVSK